jgi:chemotaxis protein MotC
VRVRGAQLAGALMLLWSGPAFADLAANPATTPYASIRTLQVLQEQIAHGNAGAQAAQPHLMQHIADRFLDADPAAWRDPRNARAAVLFLLSGGSSSVVRTVLQKATVPPDMDRLLKGALAYAEGQDGIARELLRTVDPRALPAALGGHVALVQATLLANKDPVAAGKLLDLARLLAPGSLIEEAALRRQVFLVADKDTLDKFASLSRQYVRRFHKSVYAENFKQRFTAAATKLALMGDVAQLAKLEPVLAELPVDEQRDFYLAIAKAAIVEGKTVSARFAAEKAAALAPDHSADSARAKLYIGAALIVSDEVEKGVSTLQAADHAMLSAEDADLRGAALTVAQSVQAEPPTPDDEAESDAAPPPPADAATLALMEQARKALDASDRLLKGERP